MRYIIESDTKLQAQFEYYRQLDKEIIPVKPSYQMAIPGYASLFNPSGETIGYIRHTLLYAYAEPDSSGRVHGKIYFWIWAKSMKDNQLVCTETIRYWANAYPLGELRKGTEIKNLYLNDKKSWVLGSCEAEVNHEDLLSFGQYLKKSHLCKPSIYITSTNMLAGIAALPRTHIFSEEDFSFNIRIAFFVLLNMLILIFIFQIMRVRYNEKALKKFLIRISVVFLGIGTNLLINLLI